MPTRYYFHGDELEDEPGRYYCAFCDLAVDAAHFRDRAHSESDVDRFECSKRGWSVLEKQAKGSLARPKDAKNFFAKLPKAKKAAKSSFYRWLLKQEDRDDPIGDLAKDTQKDEAFPINTNALKNIESHLINRLACDEAIQALREAHVEFRSNKRNRSGLAVSLRFEVFRRDQYRCQLCGAAASDGDTKLEVDHKVPVAKGGGDEMENLWTLCFRCNRGKGTKTL